MSFSYLCSTTICTVCLAPVKVVIAVEWSNCTHPYCKRCAASITNESLSLLNSIPRCIYPNCNQRLNIKEGYQINRLLLSKYIVNTKPEKYTKRQYLIYGYVRIESKLAYSLFPNGLISLIFDYFKLVLSARVDCSLCKSTGYLMYDCNKCNEIIQNKCKECNGTGFDYYTCRLCGGSGVHATSPPMKCFGCKGAGIYPLRPCQVCEGEPMYTFNPLINFFGCDKCEGKGQISGFCFQCKGAVTLDFNKLCHKQLICNTCHYYYPISRMVYWSNCGHTFCIECIGLFVENTLIKHTIPVCPYSMCNQELSLTTIHFIETFQIYCKKQLSQILSTLLRKKYKFECIRCFSFFGDDEKHWHNYNKTELLLWNKCWHQYGVKCVYKYVEETIIKKNAIPLCPYPRCMYPISNKNMKLIIKHNNNKLLVYKYITLINDIIFQNIIE